MVGNLKENSLLFVSRKNEKGKLELPEEGNGMPKYGSVYCEDILSGPLPSLRCFSENKMCLDVFGCLEVLDVVECIVIPTAAMLFAL